LAPTLPGVDTIPLDSLAPSIPWLSLDSQAVPATYFYAFTLSAPPFDNAAVRQAFALALDRQALTSLANSLGDDGRPATTFTPPETLGRDLYGEIGLPFNPAQAAQSLAQAGYPDGDEFPPVIFGYAADPNNAALADAAASMWRAHLGVDVTVEEIDDATFFDRIANDPPQIYALGWVADYNDPDGFLLAAFDSASSERVDGFSKPGFDRLVRQAASLATDPAARLRAYIEAERILTEQEAAIIPLYHFTQTP
jgi:oligopeptide transport system substrate-binding protein